MRVLSPLGATADTVKPLAKRPSSLDLRLGVLDNSAERRCPAAARGKHSSLLPTFGATRAVMVPIEA